MKQLADVEVIVKRETDKGVLVALADDPGKETWLPKSQVELEFDASTLGERAQRAVATMPMWLAKDKGLI